VPPIVPGGLRSRKLGAALICEVPRALGSVTACLRGCPTRVSGPLHRKAVTNAGTFRLRHRLLFIDNVLKQHHIGLEETDDGIWSIYFGQVLLGRVDERDFIIRD